MAKSSHSVKPAIPDISLTIQVWKENSTYVAYTPELDVSSCADSLRQAKARLREAVGLFLEEAWRMGTLADILAEAGFERHGKTYRARRVLAREKVRLAVPVGS